MADTASRQPVLLVARPAAGGIRSHLIGLLRLLDRSRFDISLAAPSSLQLPRSLPEFTRYDVPTSSSPSPLDVAAAWKIARLAQEQGSIVHAHGVRAALVCALARRAATFPLVVTYHNLPPAGRLGSLTLRSIAAASDAAIAVSTAITDALPGANAAVIPNGIDLSQYGATKRNSAREVLRVPSDAFVATCVARLSREKGVDLLLRAAALISEVTVLVAGTGPEIDRLTAAAPKNARLLGFVERPADIFAAADIAVVPSRSEGQGIVALEAMASGVAVCAARVGGLVETVQEETTGLLFEPENPFAIVGAIMRLRGDPDLRARLARAGNEWVQENGDIHRRVRQVEAVYKSVISR